MSVTSTSGCGFQTWKAQTELPPRLSCAAQTEKAQEPQTEEIFERFESDKQWSVDFIVYLARILLNYDQGSAAWCLDASYSCGGPDLIRPRPGLLLRTWTGSARWVSVVGVYFYIGRAPWKNRSNHWFGGLSLLQTQSRPYDITWVRPITVLDITCNSQYIYNYIYKQSIKRPLLTMIIHCYW